jgi:hypothetical protein
MLRRTVVASALAVGALLAGATPAVADPTLPPPGQESLWVTAYFSSPAKTTLVGQAWRGCGQPSGRWGDRTPYYTLHFPPCS